MKALSTVTLMKRKQVCHHPTQFLQDGSDLAFRSDKMDALEEAMGKILDRGEKAQVFTQFLDKGKPLATRLSERFGDQPL